MKTADSVEHTGKPCYAASDSKNLKSGTMPRPRINPNAHRKDIALTLPPQLIERAKLICELGGWSVSSVVEKALTNYLNALDREIGRQCAERVKEFSPTNSEAPPQISVDNT
jgi:hypothetical protein